MVNKKPIAALFGGSFDPPHKAHQEIVKKLLSIDDIEQVIVMPTFLNPFKNRSYASAKQRLDWCKRLFDDKRVVVSDYEIRQNRAVYTIESIEYLQKRYDIRYIAIGADNIDTIDKWKEFDRLNDRLTWIIFTRNGYNLDTKLLKSHIIINLDETVSSTEIRAGKKLDMLDSKIAKEIQTKREKMNIKQRVENIVKVLDEKKAEEIEVFDLSDTDYIAKEVVIANSLGGKHTLALFDHLKNELKPKGEEFLGADETDDWVVADLGDIIIHIMTPSYREHYSLEKFLSELEPLNQA